MSKKKYYVVWNGMNPGIYDSWTDCQLQIKGFPGAQYASFKSESLAKQAYDSGYEAYRADKAPPKSSKKTIILDQYPEIVIQDAWAVDAACAGNPGRMEYQCVLVRDKSLVFHLGPFALGTNNIGEFLAIVHAAALLKKNEDLQRAIYTDSRTAISWVKKKKVKTNLVKNRSTEQLYGLIGRAEDWLKRNEILNPILKWDTDEWGEIPADFGRK